MVAVGGRGNESHDDHIGLVRVSYWLSSRFNLAIFAFFHSISLLKFSFDSERIIKFFIYSS